METKPTLALFDFDGTITTKDTFIEFIKFSRGMGWFVIGFVLLSPILVLYKLKILSNSFAKQAVLTFFYNGTKEETMKKWGEQFCKKILPKLLKNSALEKIKWHQQQGHRVIIISASISYWVKPWVDSMEIELLCTEMKVSKKQKVSGWLETANCYGAEKVYRLKEFINLEYYGYIYAYGDTVGDKQMLELANEKFYRFFNN